jgi:hypothetical protein
MEERPTVYGKWECTEYPFVKSRQCPCSLRLDEGLTASHHKKEPHIIRSCTRPWAWTESLEHHKIRKMDLTLMSIIQKPQNGTNIVQLNCIPKRIL